MNMQEPVFFFILALSQKGTNILYISRNRGTRIISDILSDTVNVKCNRIYFLRQHSAFGTFVCVYVYLYANRCRFSEFFFFFITMIEIAGHIFLKKRTAIDTKYSNFNEMCTQNTVSLVFRTHSKEVSAILLRLRVAEVQ